MTDSIQIKKFSMDLNFSPEVVRLVESGEIAPEFLSADMNDDTFVDRDEFLTMHKLMNPDLDVVTANALFDDGCQKIVNARVACTAAWIGRRNAGSSHCAELLNDGETVSDLFREAFDSDDPQKRANAVSIDKIRQMPRQDRASFLLNALHDEDPIVRASAAESIRALDNDGEELELISIAMNDGDPRVRERAIKCVKYLQDGAEEVRLIRKALNDPHPMVRIMAAKSIQYCPNSDRNALFMTAMKDTDVNVRRIVIRDAAKVHMRAASNVRNKSGEELETLFKMGIKDPNPSLREYTVDSLWTLGENNINGKIRLIAEIEDQKLRMKAYIEVIKGSPNRETTIAILTIASYDESLMISNWAKTMLDQYSPLGN